MGEWIIADSSALISLTHKTDSRHADAAALRKIIEARSMRLVVPTEVLSETLNIVGRKNSNEDAAAIGLLTLGDERVVIPETNRDVLLDAVERLQTQNASVSFVDTLVMVWADYYDTDLIFGFDGIFAKRGYKLPNATEHNKAA